MPKVSTAAPTVKNELLDKAGVLRYLTTLGVTISERTMGKWIARGLLPRPIGFSQKSPLGWRRRDLEAAVRSIVERGV